MIVSEYAMDIVSRIRIRQILNYSLNLVDGIQFQQVNL